MAYYSFTKSILEGKTIIVFNHGHKKRNFTYIDDIVEGMVHLMDKPPQPNADWECEHPDPSPSYAPYKIYNIGNNQPVELMHFIHTLEELLRKKAHMEFLPMQPGDVQATYADIEDLQQVVVFNPSTPIEEGLRRFVEWYKEYYDVQMKDGIVQLIQKY